MRELSNQFGVDREQIQLTIQCFLLQREDSRVV